MTDHLKQFIDEHRHEFDDEQPGEIVLKKIQQQLADRPLNGSKHSGWRRIAIAATVLLFAAVATYFFSNRKQKVNDIVADKESKIPDEPAELTDPVFARQFARYREMIGLQQTELKQLRNDHPQLYRQFVGDMNELDSSYQALKNKLPAYPNKEMLLEAMLQNLQLQSELLNRQLLIIKEIKQKNKQYEKDKT